jgi:fructose-1,6-bisphosphatase/inositol monophosphatase family enzyme
MSPDTEKVTQIIRRVAATEIMPRFCQLADHDVSFKQENPKNLVTTADIEAEQRLSDELTRLLPGSAVVGEEGAEADPSVLSALAGDAPVWLLDPVDGTYNFARGNDCFAVIVGYCQGGQTVAGWIHDPVNDLTAWAVRGEGAWLTNSQGTKRLQVSVRRDVEQMTGSLGNRLAHRMRRRRESGLDAVPGRIVRYGCTGREYMDLARGVLDFAQYTRLKPWDHAAGVLIHSEASGYSLLTDTGSPYRPEPRIQENTVLLAPDKPSWKDLKANLAQA